MGDEMTKKELIEAMERYNDDDVVIISDGKGWCNIGTVERDGCSIVIREDYSRPFSSDN